jgi:hypothetical protein
MNPNHLYTPDELNRKLANLQDPELTWNNSFVFHHTDTKYLSESQLTKAVYPLVTGGLLINIKSMKELKDFIKTQTKLSRIRLRPSTGGRISFFKTSPNLERLKEIMSNQKIRKVIYNSLKNSGLLNKYVRVFFRAHLYLLTNDRFFNFLKMANQHLNLNKAEWESGKKFFASLDDKQLQKVVEIMVNELPALEKRKIFQPYYLLYSIMEI